MVDDLLLEGRVVDRLALRGGDDGNHMGGAVTPQCVVGHDGGLDRLTVVGEETALRHMVAERDPEKPRTQADRDERGNDDEPIPVHHSAPPGEHRIS